MSTYPESISTLKECSVHTPQSLISGHSDVKNKDRLQVVTVLHEEEFRNILMHMLAMTRRLRNIAIYKEPEKEIRNSLLYICVYVFVCGGCHVYLCAHAFEGQRPILSVVPQVPPPCFSARLSFLHGTPGHTSSCWLLMCSGNQTSVLCLHNNNGHSINWDISRPKNSS